MAGNENNTNPIRKARVSNASSSSSSDTLLSADCWAARILKLESDMAILKTERQLLAEQVGVAQMLVH